MGLRVFPATLKQANGVVALLHRHHKPVVGHRFSLAVRDEFHVHGAAIVGRPVAREVSQYEVAELTRLVTDGTKNACSILYGALCRAAKALGYREIWTYTLAEEPGTSLRAAGFMDMGITEGGEWARPSRKRAAAVQSGPKRRWLRRLA